MKEFLILLENRWILREKNKELYFRIKDNSGELKKFLENKLGYHLIITPYLIKLEKLPGKAEEWMGIQQFEDKMEYAFLCLILMFLEDKGKEEQFVLSQITEFIQGVYPEEETKIDWTMYKYRRYLIKVMRFCTEEGLIRVNDGNEAQFANEQNAEVLYESTGISRYFMNKLTTNIMEYTSWEEFENNEWADVDKDRGRTRRNRVYRRIIMSPVVYNEGNEDSDYIYIKHYHNMIENDLENNLDAFIHVHRNGTFLIFNEDKQLKDTFPDNKNISDITLQINKYIIQKIEQKELIPNAQDIIIISTAYFEKIIEECRNKYMCGWGKMYREILIAKLQKEVIKYMKYFNIIKIDEKAQEIHILPLVGKVIGDYPKDFGKEKDND